MVSSGSGSGSAVGPKCRQTFADTGRAFATSLRWKRFTCFCKGRQMRAWRHEEVPHRAVCKIIKYIVDATNMATKLELGVGHDDVSSHLYAAESRR